jgi:fatty-acyl-CoA synthase
LLDGITRVVTRKILSSLDKTKGFFIFNEEDLSMNEEFDITIGELLDQQAADYPENEAVVYVDEDIHYTYRQFREICDQAARGFMGLGIKAGDHVAIWADNRPEWLVTQFATGKMGGILVTVNTNYRAMELEYLLRHSDAQTLILSAGMRINYPEVLYEVCPELKQSEPGRLHSSKLPYLRNVIYLGREEAPPGMFHWNDVMKKGEILDNDLLIKRQASLKPDDVINMQYTSGTTGFLKG